MPPTPVLVNPEAGGASPVLRVLQEEPRCRPQPVTAASLRREVRRAVAAGAPAVLVAGGDGTLAAAADVLAGRETALGIIPAGTLNHFAHDHGIPLDPPEAVGVALDGRATAVDVGSVNGRLFLNTSAVGAYVQYVRLRNRLQGVLGYYGASLAAAVGTFLRLRSFTVEIEVDGVTRRVRSPLVFIGVGERQLRPPKLGARRPRGGRGLHLLIVRDTSRPRLLAMALRAGVRGIRPWAGEAEVESLLVERCTITLPHPHARVAADGEILSLRGPLSYLCRADALRVRLP